MKGALARVRGAGSGRGFLRAREGAAALEFAIVAVPFLFVLLATLELGLIFVANANLQNATAATARQLRVGEISATGVASTTSNGTMLDLADFKKKICSNMGLVSSGDCKTNLFIDVRQLTGFNGTMAATPYTGSTLDTSNFCFYSGVSGSVVEMRAYYLWPIFTPVMLNALINTRSVVSGNRATAGQWFALSSYEVFRNEPASNSSNTGASC